MVETEETRRKRLEFRACHRGIREMDILFTVLVKNHLDRLSPRELDMLEALLAESDHDILSWISGNTDIPVEMNNPVMDRLKAIALKPDDYHA